MHYNILALGGDRIGPEVLSAGIRVAEQVAASAGIHLTIRRDLLHGACWEVHGTFCRDETVADACSADAVLVGAIGAPKWDHIKVAGGAHMQDGLMRLRKEMAAYAGIRPARHWPELAHRTPFEEGVANQSDIMIVREMSGGVMFAEPRRSFIENDLRCALDTARYDESEIRRVALAAFELARSRKKKLVSTDKANVMESFKLWRTVVTEVSQDYPDVSLSHMYADNLAYQILMNPTQYDVVLCCNLLGDLLSDMTAVISGGLGMLPSACLCGPPQVGVKGIYEPVHGSAPDIAGSGIANPVGMIFSVGMMFEYTFGRPDLTLEIERAVLAAIADGFRTPDIGGASGTETVTGAIIERLASSA